MNQSKLRQKRVLKGLSQYELRALTGIHPSKISLMENGFIKPREDEIKRLAEALGVNEDDLFPRLDA